MPSRTGIVLLPNIFGDSKGLRDTAAHLIGLGYAVETVDIYSGHERSKPPFWLWTVIRGQNALNELAESFNYDLVGAYISMAINNLRAQDCDKAILLDYGMGGVIALKYAEGQAKGTPAGVVAYYPHLIFHKGSRHAAPDFRKIKCPVLLHYGSADTAVFPGTIELACKLRVELPTVEACIHIGTDGRKDPGHAFAETHVQGIWKNTRFYDSRMAARAWQTTIAYLQHWAPGMGRWVSAE